MDNLRIIAETDTYVWAQEKDDLRAMAIITMLAACTRTYAKEALFSFFDTQRCAVELRQYAILYERTEKAAITAVPVGVTTWAKLSRPNAAMFEARLRPLSKDEWKSGSQLWLMDKIAPYSAKHGPVLSEFFGRQFKETAEFHLTKIDGKQLSKRTIKNRYFGETANDDS